MRLAQHEADGSVLSNANIKSAVEQWQSHQGVKRADKQDTLSWPTKSLSWTMLRHGHTHCGTLPFQ
eukprot:6481453-Amphidinium_carterae.1